MKKYIILIIICLGLGVGGDELYQWKCNQRKAEPKIGAPAEPRHGTYTVITGQPISRDIVPYGGYIIIELKLNAAKNMLRVHAYDNLKFTDQDWPIECTPAPMVWEKHIIGVEIMALVGYNNSIKTVDVLYGAGLTYTRMFGGTFGVGCGVMVLRSMLSKDMYYGAKAILLAQFGSQ